MEYLVKVGGELYLPTSECSAGQTHCRSEDLSLVGVAVKNQKPAVVYLKALLNKLTNVFLEDEDMPTAERVNLLWKGERDGELDLWVNLNEIVYKPFDFFVRKCKKDDVYPMAPTSIFGSEIATPLKRFRYEQDQILSGGNKLRLLTREVLVQEVFGEAEALELAYLGYPGIKFKRVSDESIAGRFDRYSEAKRKNEITEKLTQYWANPGGLSKKHLNPISLELLRCLAENLGGLVEEDFLELVNKENLDWCECEEEEGKEEEIRLALDGLVRKRLIEEFEVEWGEGISHFRIKPKYLKPEILTKFGQDL